MNRAEEGGEREERRHMKRRGWGKKGRRGIW